MKLPYKITEAPRILYLANISYHGFGTIKIGKTAYFDYYKVDKISDDQLAKIKAFCPDAQLHGVRKEYAPEIKRVAICFPKIAWYRNKVTL